MARSRVTFGLNRRPFNPMQAGIEAIKREEELGFEYAWIPDSQMRRGDAYIQAGLALAATGRIKIGPLLSNPVTRHPSVIANGAATLGEIAPGRAAVGLGAGDTAVFTVGLRPARVAEVDRSLRLVRALLHGEAPDQGARASVPLLTKGTAELWAGASGPRMARAAGASADVIVLRTGVQPANMNALADACEAGARAAGRDPGELRFASIVHVLFDGEPVSARAQAGLVAAGFYELSAATWSRAGLQWNGPPIETIAHQVYPDLVHAEDVPTAAALTAFVADGAAAAFALYGTEQEVASGLRALLDGFPRLRHVIPQPLRWTRDYPEKVRRARSLAGL